ncbi:MAG TPA: hypothetical protein VNI20_12320 [Fimbriimonadaceae bacterium]|nr:hypothetical protein [Fimbriimonadaceae bacterium]
MRAITNGMEMHCDMVESRKSELKAFMRRFHNLRPPSEMNYWK